MALARWQPAADLDAFQADFGRLFENLTGGGRAGNGVARAWMPAVDLTETEDDLVLTADLSGMSEEDIEIELQDNVLTLSGERSDERQREGQGFHRAERVFGRFSRAVRLPRGTDPEKIAASFDRGVLEIRVPKPEQVKPHRVAIRSGSGESKEALEADATETS